MELRSTKLHSDSYLALTSFVAARHPTESCGTNGLPLTPNSIAILGQSQRLKILSHPSLCTHLDCVRGKHERIVTVTNCYKESLNDAAAGDRIKKGEDSLRKTARQILEGLSFLHRHGIVHATLEPSKILFDSDYNVKLFNYGLGHLTNYGQYVAFPIFNPRFTAPEVITEGPVSHKGSKKQKELKEGGDEDKEPEDFDSLTQIPDAPEPRYDAKCDVWSLGMMLACLALDIPHPWANLKLPQIIRKVISLKEYQGNVLDRLARECDRVDRAKSIAPGIRDLIDSCLVPNLDGRPTAQEILSNKFSSIAQELDSEDSMSIFPSLRLRCKDLQTLPDLADDDADEDQPLDVLAIQETYYLWKLAGGDILGELTKHGLMVTRPPIVSVPRLVLGEGHLEGQRKERCSLFDPIVIKLSHTQLGSCLKELSSEDCYPLLLENGHDKRDSEAAFSSSHSLRPPDETASLPLVIKEGDVKYQFKRIVLYHRLLQCYPFQRPLIWTEARVDCLPMYRAFVWASLLGIEHDTIARYEAIDKEAWTPTDRQIEVDIPRCHQYNNLLASPEGHRKFKRVLKAWVATNPEYVYWQGLDSLCAPFLYLNFNDEALAFACLSAFIPKYLHGMFQRDNAAVIQEYLAKFRHIQAFHDPDLFNHLDGIGFIPDLYAIPWILTMFAHVFPLQNIFHLWDKLLLGNSAFPLCIGLAVLVQLRERLLCSEFNDCILLFSDLPAIDIEKCVKDSVQIFCTTPKSLTWRKYGSRKLGSEDDDEDPAIAELRMDSVTLAQQKSEKVPRMSAEELLTLLGVDVSCGRKGRRRRYESGDPDADRGPASPRSSLVLVLDVRPVDEFKLGAVQDSVNVPFCSADAVNKMMSDLSEMKRGKVVCVVGARNHEKDAIALAESLLEAGHSRVCLMHGGVEVLKAVEGALRVPNG